ncbi:zf-TFIIB domain-containing protein [Pantoea phage PdC23]|uniref:Zf-TFIIB domain-containing protein n=1 Tax=Pantoea phage PdC23 TaxID=2894356 RepID=A0AAE8YHH9_9CAUD|nr:zf-TFIIB domain-containing protein [Pantoea phage PdC23]UGC97758.1 zf-TFIIB domain-containing protein [Pantoea phage PdC23]
METKFLSDGRKVVIVGQLNNTETIVQEVFVTQSGDELPGGERFVVKGLHDQPVESWLSREKARQEKALADAKLKIENINKEIEGYRNKLSFWKEMVKQVGAFAEYIDDADLEHFADVMTGQVKFAVRLGYGIPSIEKFEDFMSSIDNYYGCKNFKGIKCLCLLGSTDGDISFHVNRYSDGSGGADFVEFYNTIDEARDCVKRIALDRIENPNGNGLSIEEIKACSRMGVEFNATEIKKIKERLFAASDRNYSNLLEKFNEQVFLIEKGKQTIEEMLNEAIK